MSITRRYLATILPLTGVLILGACTEAAPSVRQAPDVIVPELSNIEKSSLTAQLLDTRWSALLLDHPEAVRPEVALVRYVWPSEWPQTQVACLQEQGVDATLAEDGSVALTALTAQKEATDLANYVCEAMYPLDPVANLPLNDSQLAYVYWYYTGPLTACLEHNGVAVDEPPSLAVFKQDFYSDRFWSPYGSIGDSDDWNLLSNKCPQAAPDLYH